MTRTSALDAAHRGDYDGTEMRDGTPVAPDPADNGWLQQSVEYRWDRLLGSPETE